MPVGLDRIFFTGSGSESADTALKMAIAYHRSRGDGSRVRLIGRQRGYHGTNFGGMSVGGIGGNRRAFVTQVARVDHLSHTHGVVPRFSRGLPESNVDLASELEDIVALHGAETVAAVIPRVDPVGPQVPPAVAAACAPDGARRRPRVPPMDYRDNRHSLSGGPLI